MNILGNLHELMPCRASCLWSKSGQGVERYKAEIDNYIDIKNCVGISDIFRDNIRIAVE